jgi:hypothetical protein
MRKYLLAAMLLLGAQVSLAQSRLTVTGTITDAGGNVATSGYVQFSLTPNSSSIQFRVSGMGVLVPTTLKCAINASGQVKNFLNLTLPCLLWGNDNITPVNTAYNVTYAPGNTVLKTVPNVLFQGVGPIDLSNPTFAPNTIISPQYSTIFSSPFQTNIIPAADGLFNIGTAGRAYNNITTHSLTVLGSFNATQFSGTNGFFTNLQGTFTNCMAMALGSGGPPNVMTLCPIGTPTGGFLINFPLASGTVPLLNQIQTWTALQTFSAGITGTGDTGALLPGVGILNTANNWNQRQSFVGINSSTGTIATTGFQRLAFLDAIAWRNNPNTGNLLLQPAINGLLTYAGQVVTQNQGASVTGNITSTQSNIALGNSITAGYRITFLVTQTVLGASCAGNTTIQFSVKYQDPSESGVASTNVGGVFTIINNGTLGRVNGATPAEYSFLTQLATPMTWTATYTAGGSCSPSPAVRITPVLEAIQ